MPTSLPLSQWQSGVDADIPTLQPMVVWYRCVHPSPSANGSPASMLTWDAEHVEDEAGQHEGQDRPVVAEAAVPELLAAVPDGRHLHQPQGDLLHQGHHLRLLVAQFHLGPQQHRWLGHWFSKAGTRTPWGTAVGT